jgi:glycosyltransferase involved in cell wall biosynthesis
VTHRTEPPTLSSEDPIHPQTAGQKPTEEPRRVFFLLDSFMLGGTEIQAVELARRLDPARYQVTIGCLRKEGPLLDRVEEKHLPVVHIDMGRGIDSPSGALAVLRLARLLRRERFEIVHAHDLWSNLVGMSGAILARVPVRITSQRDLSHDRWYGTYRRRILRFFQARSSVVLTNAGAIRDGLIERERIPPENVRVIYNGVDVARLRRIEANRKTLFPNSEGKKLVVLVGNMISDVKGHSTLISAAGEIIKAFPQVQFVLVGDGPRRPVFEQQVSASGLAGHFLFLGRRRDVPEILACCSVAVLPSLAEGLPNAVLEYMASGLPIVASALGGNLEVLEDGVTGLLVPPQDAGALAAALLKLLTDDDFANKLGRVAREDVASRFSFERLVAATENLYAAQLQAAGSKKACV